MLVRASSGSGGGGGELNYISATLSGTAVVRQKMNNGTFYVEYGAVPYRCGRVENGVMTMVYGSIDQYCKYTSDGEVEVGGNSLYYSGVAYFAVLD